MADARTDSPLENAAGAAGPYATEAFALLANETRLAILLALWESYNPDADDNAVSFSDLYEQIDYNNPGNFSYHLDQLDGQFIRKRDEGDGYELRNTGLEIVKTVIAGAGVQDRDLESTEINRECPSCQSSTAVSYEDGVIYQTCTECDGTTTDRSLPEGYLNSMRFHPAGLIGRSPGELIAAAEVAAYRHMWTMFEGLCSACSGSVDASLECCTDHESSGRCANCGRTQAHWARFQCRVCKDHHVTTPAVLSVFHPAVVGFLYDHGIPIRWHTDEFQDLSRHSEQEPEYDMTLLSESPPEVVVSISIAGEALHLTFDETVTVTDVTY